MSANLPFFWQIWVVGLILVSLAFVAYAVIRIYFPKEPLKEHEGLTWDETLAEGSFAPPKWWFWLIISALFFSVIYMALYPGFGNYNGLFDLTTAKEYQQGKQRIDNKYSAKLQKLSDSTIPQLQNNPDAMRLAKNIYNNNCIQCHAPSAKGQANIFPDLTDDDWLWGSSFSQVNHSIKYGRLAVMPAWGAILDDKKIDNLARYVRSLSTKNSTDHAKGKATYQQFCVGCHNLNATGKPLIGAPNLADNISLYGNNLNAIKTSISSGRRGVMPAQQSRLSDLQIKLISAWLTKK